MRLGEVVEVRWGCCGWSWQWCHHQGWWCVPWPARRRFMEGLGGCSVVSREWNNEHLGRGFVWRFSPEPESGCSNAQVLHQIPRGVLGGIGSAADATHWHVSFEDGSARMLLARKKKWLKEFSSDKCHKNTYAGICKAWNICSRQCFDHVVRLLKWYFHEISEILMAAGFLSVPFFHGAKRQISQGTLHDLKHIF